MRKTRVKGRDVGSILVRQSFEKRKKVSNLILFRLYLSFIVEDIDGEWVIVEVNVGHKKIKEWIKLKSLHWRRYLFYIGWEYDLHQAEILQ